MTHPSEADLALYAGGDLSFVEAWLVRRHIQKCTGCERDVKLFAQASGEFAEGVNQLPNDFQWERLASEISANIHVGLQAAECVTPVRHNSPRLDWRAAAVMAAMSVVLLAAWYLNPMPRAQEHAMRAPRVEIRTTSAGLEVNENGNALTLMNGNGAQQQRAIIVSTPGTLRARFADGDTGQITINNVYSE